MCHTQQNTIRKRGDTRYDDVVNCADESFTL